MVIPGDGAGTHEMRQATGRKQSTKPERLAEVPPVLDTQIPWVSGHQLRAVPK